MNDEEFLRARQIITSGGIVAYPTETYYALAVAPNNIKAVKALMQIKGREERTGIPLIISHSNFINSCIADEMDEVRNARQLLINKFWPAPLSIIISVSSEKQHLFCEGIYGTDYSIAVRCSPHSTASKLAYLTGGVITSTSANLRGELPSASVSEVKSYFPDIFVLEVGKCGVEEGVLPKPSTLLDVRSLPFHLLREGAMEREIAVFLQKTFRS